ncbi:MAG: hypothetical protein ABI960_00955 [Candidatus Eisenbacteria bacterium]
MRLIPVWSQLAVIAFVGTLVTATPPRAATSPRARPAAGQSLELSVGLMPFYDDNVLEYSDNQIAEIESGLHPDRYSIRSRDDLVVQPELGLVYRVDQGGGRRRIVRLRGIGRFNDKNATADDHALSAGWRESFQGGRTFAASYYTLPDYYLRQLYDEDAVVPFPGLSKYRRAGFALKIPSVEYAQRLSHAVRAALDYQYERRNYNDDFNERDSGTHQVEAELALDRLRHRGRIAVLGGYRTSKARGSDGDSAGVTPDDVDVSYHGPIVGLSGRLGLGRGRHVRFDGDASYTLSGRHYTSDRPADKYHYLRQDWLHKFELGLGATIHRSLHARGFYRRKDANARLGTSAPPVSDSGSYRVNQVGLELDWVATLWHRASAPSQGDADSSEP